MQGFLRKTECSPASPASGWQESIESVSCMCGQTHAAQDTEGLLGSSKPCSVGALLASRYRSASAPAEESRAVSGTSIIAHLLLVDQLSCLL